jgi:hypothetical protein
LRSLQHSSDYQFPVEQHHAGDFGYNSPRPPGNLIQSLAQPGNIISLILKNKFSDYEKYMLEAV